jgi:hypothetical protein
MLLPLLHFMPYLVLMLLPAHSSSAPNIESGGPCLRLVHQQDALQHSERTRTSFIAGTASVNPGVKITLKYR